MVQSPPYTGRPEPYATENISDQSTRTSTQGDSQGFTPPWAIKTPFHGMMQASFDTLKKLSHLPPNWDSYGALPPTPVALAVTKHFLTEIDTMLGQYADHHVQPELIVPLADGGVQIEWSTRAGELDIQVGPTGTFGYLWTDQREPKPLYREADNSSWETIIQLIIVFVLES